VLTDRQRWSTDGENLHEILEALREAEVSVDEAQLLDLLTALEGRAEKYPQDRMVAAALLLLAGLPSDAALHAIKKGLDHPSVRVRKAAAEAELVVAGIDDAWRYAGNRCESVGWEGVSDAQRNVLAVRELAIEVDNGGFLQYFVNTSGDHWRDAVAGLTAIGDERGRDLLEQAIAKFGKTPPSETRSERHAQVARLPGLSTETFNDIEKAFYANSSSRDVLLLKYAGAHADEFRDPAS
jgi:hypothetical protein